MLPGRVCAYVLGVLGEVLIYVAGEIWQGMQVITPSRLKRFLMAFIKSNRCFFKKTGSSYPFVL